MHLRMGIAALLAGASLCEVAVAQTTGMDVRVGKLEKEMKAVQRTVFPQGVPVQPESGSAAPATAVGAPATAPIADLTARVDALEKSLASLTGQIEQVQFRNRQQDEAIKRIEAALNPVATADTAVVPRSPQQSPMRHEKRPLLRSRFRRPAMLPRMRIVTGFAFIRPSFFPKHRPS